MIEARTRSLAAMASVCVLAIALVACGSPEPAEPLPPGPPGGPVTTAPVPNRPTSRQATPGNRNQGSGSHTVSGRTYDRRGRPLPGVEVHIIIVPRSYGSLYRVRSDSNGRYSYRVPEGVYNVTAEYDVPDDGDPIGMDLVTETGELSMPITVPPGQVVDFRLP